MTAAAAGFSMPPEWAPQEAVWLSWPVEDPRHWGGAKRQMIWAKFAEIAAAISHFEIVRINAPRADHAAIHLKLRLARTTHANSAALAF